MTDKQHANQGLPEFRLHEPSHDHSRSGVVRTAKIAALAVVLVLLSGLAWVLVSRWSSDKLLAARAAQSSLSHVRVISPVPGSSNTRLTLPGTLQGKLEAKIYARTTGYVKKWHKDIGDHARRGEALATLDIPEVNKQVEEAEANFQLAKVEYERWSRLRGEDAVSQQELDEKIGAYRQTEAVLKRLRDQQGFGEVVAPFDGIVTKRNVNVGDLVNAGNGGTGQSMFSMAETGHLFVYAYVPQDRASSVHIGDPVEILLADRPDRPIKGHITRSAGAIDMNTRTLQIEVDIPNPRHALLPGAYVDVALSLPPTGNLMLPTDTLLFDGSGTQVAVVRDGKAYRQKVALGTDYGLSVEVKSGVSATDQVIVNPPDSIVSGQAVEVDAGQPQR
jgi:multidrug efflux system membrane fusion protein